MATRLSFLLLALGMLASWGGLAYLVSAASPEELGNRLAFFLLLTAAVLLTTAVLAFGLSFRLYGLKRHQGDLRRSLLQGLPPAVLLTVAAWLQSLRVLSLLIAAILVGLVVALEYVLWPRETED